ncbi:CvpA family protein [Tundrisphaera sp. TA3]|uniref:CvpA family protein n=1 Tax=Tundrisphaera sp. TA3 TaxID=3435775 RepID=UPI003EBEBE08
MGLDIALGVVILLGAIRGWFRGFLLPGIRLAALIGCVFAAAPLRDQARPHVTPYLATIQPAMLDKMLWWASAVVSYVAVVGLSSLAIALQRRKPAFGEPDENRADQFAGMLLGGAKATIVAAFLVAGLDRYAREWAHTIPWAEKQAKTSRALVLNDEYRPAERIWTSPPVRHFVAHIRRMGISGEAAETPGQDAPAPVAEIPAVQTAAARPPHLSLPDSGSLPNPSSDDFLQSFDRALEKLDRPEPRQ